MLLPLVADRGWFFDTELLVLAQRCGLRVCEVPVDWTDSADSRVKVVSTALGDLRGIARLRWGLWTGTLKLPVPGSDGCGGVPGIRAAGYGAAQWIDSTG